jgi:phospholipid/cholesterol/gamma-HCH transport system permease protein
MSQALSRIFGATGAFLLHKFDYLVSLTSFLIFALLDWAKNFRFFNRYSYRPLITQIIFTGVDAIPTIIFLGLVTGFIFTFRMIALFESLTDTLSILIFIIGLEAGPMIAAIILISRTGSAITVDIANMKLHREIQSIEYLGMDIHSFLVAPRIIGVTISQLAVAVFFTAITLISGILLSGLMLSPTHYKLIYQIANHIQPIALLVFVIKNILFGLTIGATACFHGLQVGVSPTEVPQQTQRAIINMLVMLFVIDGILALLMI